ncbi:MAG: insulinase family protein [Planctomycetes bacterium]|nr:insulinase family protein [Planctomycetota bacterium]
MVIRPIFLVSVLALSASAISQNPYAQAVNPSSQQQAGVEKLAPVQVGEFIFHRAILPNGVRALAVQDTGGTASVFVVIAAGNRDESPETSGLAHLTEHALYTGTPTTGADEHDRIVKQELGAESNAFTRDDYTLYYDHGIPADALQRVLEMEADRMAHLTFDEAPVLHERERLRIEETHTWRPSTTREEQLESAVYRREGYRVGLRDENGHTKAPGIELGPIKEFYQTYYRPDNAAVVVVTPDDPQRALRQIAKAFGEWKAPKMALPNRVGEGEPLGARSARFESELARDRVEFCWVVPPRAHKDSASLALLARMLDRRDTSAGDPFQVSYYERQGSGMFTIASTGENAYKELEALCKSLDETGVKAEEITNAVREERDRFLNLPLRARPYFSLAADMGRMAVYNEEQWIAGYHLRIDEAGKSSLGPDGKVRTGSAGVGAALKRWLNPKRRVIVHFAPSGDGVAAIELPEKTKDLAVYAQEAMEAGEYQKAVVAYTELLNRNPDKMNTVIYLYYLGSLHMDHKHYDEAIADFEKALKVVDYPAVRDALEEAERLRDDALGLRDK